LWRSKEDAAQRVAFELVYAVNAAVEYAAGREGTSLRGNVKLILTQAGRGGDNRYVESSAG
jgi:hypothetical protein